MIKVYDFDEFNLLSEEEKYKVGKFLIHGSNTIEIGLHQMIHVYKNSKVYVIDATNKYIGL